MGSFLFIVPVHCIDGRKTNLCFIKYPFIVPVHCKIEEKLICVYEKSLYGTENFIERENF